MNWIYALFLAIALVFVPFGYVSSVSAPEVQVERPAEYAPTTSVDVKTETITQDGLPCIMQTAMADLDGDGVRERITASFTCFETYSIDGEPPIGIYDTCEIVVQTADGEEFAHTWEYYNLTPDLNFTDFDTRDRLMQFYVVGEGPSADPYTQVFSFDGMQVLENVGFPGYLEEYDGQGRLFADINVNAYYDLYDGLTPLPKENIVGTEIQRGFNLLLMENPGTEYTVAVISEMYMSEERDLYIEFAEELICVVPADTPLTVLDIEFLGSRWSESDEPYYVPWLKVQTPDGTEGWFCVIYGD